MNSSWPVAVTTQDRSRQQQDRSGQQLDPSRLQQDRNRRQQDRSRRQQDRKPGLDKVVIKYMQTEIVVTGGRFPARPHCGICRRRPGRRMLCQLCNRQVGPCCWDHNRQCCVICARQEPEPEPTGPAAYEPRPADPRRVCSGLATPEVCSGEEPLMLLSLIHI